MRPGSQLAKNQAAVSSPIKAVKVEPPATVDLLAQN